jgi:hypothetical protein
MSKPKQGQIVRMFRAAIPTFTCVPGCTDCCGPVPASEWELKRLPRLDPATRAACYTADGLSCPHQGPLGCMVYEERPLVCRLFGTVEKLPCPHGRRPAKLLDPQVEREILRYTSSVKHALL